MKMAVHLTMVQEHVYQFPLQAFVDSKGNTVKGKVIVQYVEFRSPVDFILRGIPMSIVVNGNLLPFQLRGYV
jgi:hypothetical protein